MKIFVDRKCLNVTIEIARCLKKHFPDLFICVLSDISGEDHVYARDKHKAVFDLFVSSSRKFIFLWYYIQPSKGFKMVAEMKQISLENGNDFIVKFPNVPVQKPASVKSKVPNKDLYPTILRFGKRPSGISLKEFIIKAGNPQLEKKVFKESTLKTFRNYNWNKIPNALDKILERSKKMAIMRLKNHPEKVENIRGYCLYAGCAYSFAFPELGFGMRDIDVQVFFSPEWFTNTRCAFTRYCKIEEFGRPEYFNKHTRWLDLMWNSFHEESDSFKKDVVNYICEMRHKSDRWATMSQRPFIDLESKEIIYVPNWIKKLKKFFNRKE